MLDIKYKKKKSKKKVKAKNYKNRRGDVAHHGSSINRINIRIVPQQQTSSTPAIHPDAYTLAEQTRLHLGAVQQLVLDNHKPEPSMPPRPPTIRVPTTLSGNVRVDGSNPFHNQVSPPALILHPIAQPVPAQQGLEIPSPSSNPSSIRNSIPSTATTSVRSPSQRSSSFGSTPIGSPLPSVNSTEWSRGAVSTPIRSVASSERTETATSYQSSVLSGISQFRRLPTREQRADFRAGMREYFASIPPVQTFPTTTLTPRRRQLYYNPSTNPRSRAQNGGVLKEGTGAFIREVIERQSPLTPVSPYRTRLQS